MVGTVHPRKINAIKLVLKVIAKASYITYLSKGSRSYGLASIKILIGVIFKTTGDKYH